MLIEFRVANYRSVKTEQVLSLTAAKDLSHADTHLISTGVKGVPHVVRTAVLYGPNASGKSNLIKALTFMRGVVTESAVSMQLGQTFNVQPFRLDREAANQPSEFEITFIEDGVRYQYGFRLTAEQIHEEWLLVYKTAKAQQWFVRRYNRDSEQDEYEWSSHLTGQRKLWQEATRRNALFLSTAVQLNSEQLRPVFNWIVNKLAVFAPGILPLPDYSVGMLKSDEGKRDIEEFMKSADISIVGISTVARKGITFHLDHSIDKMDVKREESDMLFPQFRHVTESGEATFEQQDESLGTQRLFSLAGPVLSILESGAVLVIDELDSSLHPLLVRRLVDMFHNPALNTKGAQLIFSTHDTSLLDKEIFRRDQIWFVEKDHYQATMLYPLTDFSPRKNEALERGYLMGRYGAIPVFHDLDL